MAELMTVTMSSRQLHTNIGAYIHINDNHQFGLQYKHTDLQTKVNDRLLRYSGQVDWTASHSPETD